jgi:hypothetical protein
MSRLSPSLKFVLMVGVMSFFADFTYEGSRSIVGQYLGLLGAGALAISMVTGFGELLGYGLRLFSGRGADRTGLYWPITIGGYILQMSVVPLLALAGSWQVAALLIILERLQDRVRRAGDPGRDNAVAAVVARRLYPRPQDLEAGSAPVSTGGLPRAFWIYLAAAALVGAGFADFPIIAYHFQRAGTVRASLIPIFYAAAMAASSTGSLVFGRLFARHGIGMLVPLTIVAAVYAPLAFLGGFWSSLVGVCLWGLGMGVHESIIPAVVAPMVSPDRRASAYGLFTCVYGIAWFLGSTAIGAVFSVSFGVVVAFALVAELAAIPLLIVARRQRPRGRTAPAARPSRRR